MSIKKLSMSQHQQLIKTALGKEPPDICFQQVNLLNVYNGKIEKKNIWIKGDRIAYVGDNIQSDYGSSEVVTLKDNQLVVPGYIEPHAHPNQMYNPLTLGEFLSEKGTTVSINDNLSLFMNMENKQALDLINELDQTGTHLWLWWAYFDAKEQQISDQETRFSLDHIREWLQSPLVVQGGEFTAWPKLTAGNEDLTNTILFLKQESNKRMEAHLPGASVKTLNALAAAGMTADHESMTAKEVLDRLSLGYYTAIRYSSIRPDLPLIFRELSQYPDLDLSRLMMTNDGASVNFLERATHSEMIKLAMKENIKPADAYRFATLYPAVYYRIDDLLGGIAPGRIAHLNIIDDLSEPAPSSVLFAGKWMYKHGVKMEHHSDLSFIKRYFPKIQQRKMNVDLSQKTGNTGIQLLNDVITKSYTFDPTSPLDEDECHLIYIDKMGSQQLKTRIKGFSKSLYGLASTYSASQDTILIGKDINYIHKALQHIEKLGGGIIAFTADGKKTEIPLPLSGIMSDLPVSELKDLAANFTKALKKSGFPYDDPAYSLLFLTATHLPSVRLTSKGLYTVKNKTILAGTTNL
ncbi:adenine deaminase C-terminal domain-containing protein [Bacillus atrophaeus]